jgi:hypothetical protein
MCKLGYSSSIVVTKNQIHPMLAISTPPSSSSKFFLLKGNSGIHYVPWSKDKDTSVGLTACLQLDVDQDSRHHITKKTYNFISDIYREKTSIRCSAFIVGGRL